LFWCHSKYASLPGYQFQCFRKVINQRLKATIKINFSEVMGDM